MTDQQYNPWETTDGLPSDFEGKIVSGSFLYDVKYNNGQTLLASFMIDRLDGEGEIEIRYPLGPGWTAVGGERVVHDSGPQAKFNKQTAYGEFVSRVVALVPTDELSGRDPHEIRTLTGLTFFFERVTTHREFTDKEGKLVSRDVSRTWPTRFISDTGTPAESSSAPTVALSGGGVVVTLNEDLATQVKSLANALDYDKWASSVLSLPGALDSEDLIHAVSNQAFYAGLKA